MAAALKDVKENLELKFICDQIESYNNFTKDSALISNKILEQTPRGTALFAVLSIEDEEFPLELKPLADSFSKFYLYRLRTKIYSGDDDEYGRDGIQSYIIHVSVKPSSKPITLYYCDIEGKNWQELGNYALVVSNLNQGLSKDRLRVIPKTTLEDESRGYKLFVPKMMDNTNNNAAAGVYHQMPAAAQPSLNQLADAGNAVANNSVAAATTDANSGAAKPAAK